MKTELKLFPTALKEIFIFSFVLLVYSNGLVYLIFTTIKGIPFGELFRSGWIVLVVIPLIQGILQPISNRNGVLTLKSIVKPEETLRRLDELMVTLNYLKIGQNENCSRYDNKTKWKRIANRLFRGKIKVICENNAVNIYGKRVVLEQIETKVKADKAYKELNENE